MDARNPKQTVREGYDAVSHLYRDDGGEDGRYAAWLAALDWLLRPGAAVLDLGCGCGVPVARSLTRDGFQVTGVDFSEVQVERARALAPAATFVHADVTDIAFAAETFDAIVCLYTLIHIPLDEQPPLLHRIADWLRPGGWLLATTGHHAWTGTERNWLGGSAPMWWSHADADTYRTWIADAGLHVTSDEFVPEGDSGHQLFWARRLIGRRPRARPSR
ncbi:MAG: class I SAM-dependent methyltransferase [Streptosporangiales bacterium]|nr:class I SAM-dependent methyltransferase [Streptosporangiales bacterium]MBO0889331.1 class I SAM-dependent methyltransferase [Acidothermales bacterium]